MPFVIGRKESIPEEYQHYWPLLEGCQRSRCRAGFGRAPSELLEEGKVGYLTIQESFTEAGHSHRRGGIHAESPGVVMGMGRKGSGGKLYVIDEIGSWGFGKGGKERCVG